MLKRLRKYTKSLSVRLSLMVVGAIAMLLLVSLGVMFYSSRKALKNEALLNAEQTLEGTMQHIDNIFLSVEQATGNVYFHMLEHLDQPELMFDYSRRLVESCPYIVGCAIVFVPDYYPGRELFMAYVHRKDIDPVPEEREQIGSGPLKDDELIYSESFAGRPYTEQIWYTLPMEKAEPIWTGPLKGNDAEDEALTTFCLPFQDAQGRQAGVMAVDVSTELLSQIVLSAKPSFNGYCTLLSHDGSYIIHPDTNKLNRETVFTQIEKGADPSLGEAAKEMISGRKGYKQFKLWGKNYYVFYKPLQRSQVKGRAMEKLDWSVGVVYPEDDIFGDYNRLLYIALAIAIVGIILLFVLCRAITHRQLMPLRMLTHSAQHIAEGNYNEQVPDSRQHDEIGLLQDNFQRMQQSLAVHVSELEKLKATLNERGEVLREAYRKTKEADNMKMAFLHNMTDQMATPTAIIAQDVAALLDFSRENNTEETGRLANDIKQQGKVITELLRHLLNASETETEKEDAYV